MQVEVKKKMGESNEALVRRFTKKVLTSGMLMKYKQGQFKERSKSRNKQRQDAVVRIKIRKEKQYLKKIGRLEEIEDKKNNYRRR